MNEKAAESRARIERAAECLLDGGANPSHVLQGCQALADALASVGGFDAGAAVAHARLRLPDGIAIAPAEAARCVLDSARTVAFLRATAAALVALQGRGRRLEILYAGCGPLAPLAIGILHRLPAGAGRFWLVDAQPEAVRSAQKLVTELDLADRFAPLECVDAAHHGWPLCFDLVIVEAMQRALEKEPQVAVTANVARHLREDGVFIPACVELDLCFYDPKSEHATAEGGPRLRAARTPLLRLTSASAAELLRSGAKAESRHEHPRALHAMVSTRVRVAVECELEEYASAITLPLPAHELGAIDAGQPIAAQYSAQPLPGVQFRRGGN